MVQLYAETWSIYSWTFGAWCWLLSWWHWCSVLIFELSWHSFWRRQLQRQISLETGSDVSQRNRWSSGYSVVGWTETLDKGLSSDILHIEKRMARVPTKSSQWARRYDSCLNQCQYPILHCFPYISGPLYHLPQASVSFFNLKHAWLLAIRRCTTLCMTQFM